MTYMKIECYFPTKQIAFGSLDFRGGWMGNPFSQLQSKQINDKNEIDLLNSQCKTGWCWGPGHTRVFQPLPDKAIYAFIYERNWLRIDTNHLRDATDACVAVLLCCAVVLLCWFSWCLRFCWCCWCCCCCEAAFFFFYTKVENLSHFHLSTVAHTHPSQKQKDSGIP